MELWPEEAGAERADLSFRLALALFGADDERREDALEEARAALLLAGDRKRAAEADSVLAEVLWLKGEGGRCHEHLERALELVREEPPSPEKARVLSQVARYALLAGELDLEVGADALELAESLELDEIIAHVLITLGTARSIAGDQDGWDDIERGLEMALAGNWLAVWVLVETGHLAEARALADELLSAGHHSFELAIEPLMWAGEALGLTDRMRVALAAVRGGPWRDAAEAVLVGDFESAARVLDEIGAAPHAALARLRAARALIDAGRRAEGDVQLQRALTFWRSVGATRYVREGEALLAASA